MNLEIRVSVNDMNDELVQKVKSVAEETVSRVKVKNKERRCRNSWWSEEVRKTGSVENCIESLGMVRM